MRLWSLSRYLISSCLALVLLAGCGGSLALTGATPRGNAESFHNSRGGSWMLPDAKGKNLLYAVSNDVVNVYTYPGGKLIGSLGWFNAVVGICVNKTGDVFIPVFGDYRIYEYPHGGTTQKAVLKTPYTVVACAVDPKTQDVAAASYYGLIMFPYGRNHHYKFAKYYRDPVLYFGAYCTYDSKGDLFMDGTTSGEFGFALSELPKGSKTFSAVTLNQKIVGPGELQWLNGTLTVADRGKPNGPAKAAFIYGFTIASGTGTEVSKTRLKGSYDLAQFWIQNNRVVGPESGSTGGIGVWDYPRGRAPVESIVGPAPTGIVISLK